MSQSLLKGIPMWALPTFIVFPLALSLIVKHIINGETTSYFLRKSVKNPKRTGLIRVRQRSTLSITTTMELTPTTTTQQQQQQRRRRWNNYKAIETALRVGTSNYMERQLQQAALRKRIASSKADAGCNLMQQNGSSYADCGRGGGSGWGSGRADVNASARRRRMNEWKVNERLSER